MQKPRALPLIGTAGILLSALIAVVTGIIGFSGLPLDTPDFLWVGIYLVLIAGLGFLLYQQNYRLLNGLVLGATGLLVAIIFVFSDNGPAILAWFWLALISAGLGNIFWNILKLGRDNDLLERLFIGTALGVGALAVLTFGLGSANVFAEKLGLPARYFRLLHPIPVYAILILLTALVLPGLYRTWKRWLLTSQEQIKTWLSQRQFEVSVTLAVLFLTFAAAFIWALSPTIRFDSLVYHLSAPETYVEHRGIIEVTEPMHFYMAHYAEMVFTLALVVAGQPLPALMHLLSGVITVGLTFLIAYRLGLPKAGWVAALLFVSLPLFYDAGTVHNDYFVAMFSAASFCSILFWWQEQKNGWLVLAGILAGLSIGTKINAASPALVGALAILAGQVARRTSWKRALVELVSYAFPVALLYVPWAALNALWVGNPLHPFFCSLFTCPKISMGSNPVGNGSSLLKMFVSRFLLLPFNITLFGNDYYIENFGGIAAGVFLFALPWLAAFRKIDNKLRKTWVWLAVFTAVNFLLLIPFSHRVRYVLPVIPVLCILAAINLLILWNLLQTTPKRNAVLLACLFVSGLYLLSTRLVVTSSGWQLGERYPYKVAIGLETADEFLSRTLPAFDALQFLDGEGNGIHKVAAFGTEARMYSRSDVHTTYYSSEITSILAQAATLEDLARLLKQAGYNYILYDRDGYSDMDSTIEDTRMLEEPFLSKYARLVFSRNHVDLYQLTWQENMQIPVIGANQLENSDFEEIGASGQPVGWEEISSPTITTDAALAHSGKTAVQASNLGYLYQRIAVEPNHLYTFGFWSRGDIQGQLARLQIIWLDSEMKSVRTTIEKFETRTGWTWHQLSYSAPKGAVLAQIFVTTDDNRQAWFDSACFAEGPECK